jgi:hypothetical protein
MKLVEQMKNFLKKLVHYLSLMNWKITVPIILLCLLGLGGGVFFWTHRTQDSRAVPDNWSKYTPDSVYTPDYELTPTKSGNFGVSSNEQFTFTSKQPTDLPTIEKQLVASKKISISQNSPTKYVVSLNQQLGANETIDFSLANTSDYAWSFQTPPLLAITNTAPYDHSTTVPLRAGIEATFNSDNFVADGTKISIEPKIKFTLEKHEAVLSIVPSVPMSPSTIYTVTIQRGFGGSKNQLQHEHSWSFQTTNNGERHDRLELTSDYQEIAPGNTLITKVNSSSFDSTIPIHVAAYVFPSYESFVQSRKDRDATLDNWMLYYGEQHLVNLSSLREIASIDTTVKKNDDLSYIEFPHQFDEGLYLIQYWYDDKQKVEQLWLQSTPLAGYVSIGKTQSVVWLTSIDHQPVNSSVIQVFGSNEQYTTNNDGVSIFSTPSMWFENDAVRYLLATTSQGKRLLLPVRHLQSRAKPADIVASDYWSYFYHERSLYKPTDTIYFWGVAKHRDTNTPPSTVSIYLDDDLRTNVAPQADGTFFGSFKIENEPARSARLIMKVADVELETSYISITEYTKPELKIDLQADKKVILSGEKVRYSGRVTFFDGTPATNVTLRVSAQDQQGLVDRDQVVADKSGAFSFEYTAVRDDNTYPRYEGVTVSANKSGESTSDGSAQVFVYKGRAAIFASTNQDKSQAQLAVTIKRVSIDRVNSGAYTDVFDGTLPNQSVHLSVTRRWWERQQSGTYYDFAEKVTRPKYTYNSQTAVVESIDLTTDSLGQINHSFAMQPSSSYTVQIRTNDDRDTTIDAERYFYYSDDPSGQQRISAQLNLNHASNEFSLNESVEFEVQSNNSTYPTGEHVSFLYVIANRGKQEAIVSKDPRLIFSFERKYTPGVYVGSIIFTGSHFEEVRAYCKSGWDCGYDYYGNEYQFQPVLVRYKSSQSELAVDITADKQLYSPGDTAVVAVKVTKQGSPVSNAAVQLVSVDEALVAIGQVITPSPLTSLYSQVPAYVYFSYYSHKPAIPDGPMAERGGGGGARELFKDVAYFGIQTTNSEGIATFSFTLPDDITTWTTFAQSVAGDMDAGYSTHSLVSSKPFFITSQFPHIFTVKDRPAIALATYGTSLSESAPISGTVEVTQNEHSLLNQAITLTPFNESFVNFPQLRPGTYAITSQATSNQLSDAVKKSATVIESRLALPMTSQVTLQQKESKKPFERIIPDATKPISLIVSDSGKGSLLTSLYRYCGTSSNRIERILASLYASNLLDTHFHTACARDAIDFASFQSANGGIRPTIWSDSDLSSSVWAAYVNPDVFNKSLLMDYFTNAFSNTIEDQIFINWGQSLLGKPMVNSLNQLVPKATTYRQKVYAALAEYSVGNVQKSKALYYSILNTYIYANKPYLRVESSPTERDYDTYYNDTSYMLLLSALLGDDQHVVGFQNYLNDYGNRSSLVSDLTSIVIVENRLKRLPPTNTIVELMTPSKKVVVDLTKEGMFSTQLKAADLPSTSLVAKSGSADVQLLYSIGSDQFNSLTLDDRIAISKSITKIKGGTDNEMTLGDIVQVTLTYSFSSTAPLGCYLITDTIPSGMAYIDDPSRYDISTSRQHLLYSQTDHVVEGCVSHSSWWKDYFDNKSIYYMRAAGSGSYQVEPAFIQSATDQSIIQKTNEDSIVIK